MTIRNHWMGAAMGVVLSFTLPVAPALGQGIPVSPTGPTVIEQLANQIEQITNQIEQIAVLESQLAQAMELYQQFASIASVGDLANLLNDPELRGLLPEGMDSFGDSLSGGLDNLGRLADRAEAIRSANSVGDIYSALEGAGDDMSEAERFYLETLNRTGEMAARDMALGEEIMSQATVRLEGLEELRLDAAGAGTVGELAAIAARIDVENAMMTNDLVRLEGLRMAQEAELRIVEQQEAEIRELERRRRGCWWVEQSLEISGESPVAPDAFGDCDEFREDAG